MTTYSQNLVKTVMQATGKKTQGVMAYANRMAKMKKRHLPRGNAHKRLTKIEGAKAFEKMKRLYNSVYMDGVELPPRDVGDV